MHVFPFSPRPGTRAAELPGRLSHGELEERTQQVLELAERLESNFIERMVGKELAFIIERTNGRAEGLSDNYLRGVLSGENLHKGQLVRAEITGVRNGALIGRSTR